MPRLILLINILLFSSPTYAYLDPGTGSMLLSAIVGLIATLLFSIKSSYYKVVGLFYRLTGRKIEKNDAKIVFYSEGRQYWHTFKPVLQALNKKQIEAVYLTSDESDQGLKFNSEFISTKYIGQGNRAYSYLNMLEADICAMTTPGLDVLQIRRSKGVKHYAHLVHAPTDMGTYKLFSFDYYDSIFCSGEHQKKSIRTFERLRGTEEKLLFDSGCPYMDVLADKLDSYLNIDNNSQTILLAPTWGQNGLLSRFGSKLIEVLLQTDMDIVIRPHPQSYISEIDLMTDLESKFANEPRVSWDRSADNFNTLLNSCVLVSDLSGVVFDYAFIFEKPVITVDFEYNWDGMEANDLPYPLWELNILPKLGININENQIIQLPTMINDLLAKNDVSDQLIQLRSESLFNYRNTGEIIADQLLSLIPANSTVVDIVTDIKTTTNLKTVTNT